MLVHVRARRSGPTACSEESAQLIEQEADKCGDDGAQGRVVHFAQMRALVLRSMFARHGGS